MPLVYSSPPPPLPRPCVLCSPNKRCFVFDTKLVKQASSPRSAATTLTSTTTRCTTVALTPRVSSSTGAPTAPRFTVSHVSQHAIFHTSGGQEMTLNHLLIDPPLAAVKTSCCAGSVEIDNANHTAPTTRPTLSRYAYQVIRDPFRIVFTRVYIYISCFCYTVALFGPPSSNSHPSARESQTTTSTTCRTPG